MCREDAFEISSRFAAGDYAQQQVKLIGVVKEVAPVAGAATDEVLGVGEFQSKYFHNFPLYMDSERHFYSYLGNKSLLSQPLHSWNPFKLYSDFQSLNQRLKEKHIDGNLKGEGLLKGGLLIISPKDGIVYRHEEATGTEMPYDEIEEVLRSLTSAAVDGKEGTAGK